MDMTAEVPEFKIARVGKERKRKGAGLPLFGGGNAGGGLFSGATGGVGSAAAGGLGLLGKMAVLALVATLSAGAWQVGKALRPDENASNGGKPKVFASNDHKYSDADLANVMKSNNGMMPNSLGYISGSMDGMTAEERAKKEAEAAAAAKAAEEEAKKAEEEAAKEPKDVAAGSPAGMDPNALMKGLGGPADGKDAKKGFDKKFGSLGSMSGSGLSGGAGLAGGVGRGFANLDIPKANNGKMAAMGRAASPTTSKAAAARAGRSNARGLAGRQLAAAQSLSKQAASSGRPETSAQTASQAFDNNNGAGTTISGPGVGTGAGTGAGDAGGSVNPGNSGGPIDSGSTDPNTQPNTVKGKNVTPWQSLVDIALVLMAIASIISVVLAVAKMMSAAWVGTVIASYCMMALMAIGAIVALLGVAIMAMGGGIQGGILMATGGLLAVFAYIANGAFGAQQAVSFSAGQLVGVVASSLAGTALGGMSGQSGSMQ